MGPWRQAEHRNDSSNESSTGYKSSVGMLDTSEIRFSDRMLNARGCSLGTTIVVGVNMEMRLCQTFNAP